MMPEAIDRWHTLVALDGSDKHVSLFRLFDLHQGRLRGCCQKLVCEMCRERERKFLDTSVVAARLLPFVVLVYFSGRFTSLSIQRLKNCWKG